MVDLSFHRFACLLGPAGLLPPAAQANPCLRIEAGEVARTLARSHPDNDFSAALPLRDEDRVLVVRRHLDVLGALTRQVGGATVDLTLRATVAELGQLDPAILPGHPAAAHPGARLALAPEVEDAGLRPRIAAAVRAQVEALGIVVDHPVLAIGSFGAGPPRTLESGAPLRFGREGRELTMAVGDDPRAFVSLEVAGVPRTPLAWRRVAHMPQIFRGEQASGSGVDMMAELFARHGVVPLDRLVTPQVGNASTLLDSQFGAQPGQTKMGRVTARIAERLGLAGEAPEWDWRPDEDRLDIVMRLAPEAVLARLAGERTLLGRDETRHPPPAAEDMRARYADWLSAPRRERAPQVASGSPPWTLAERQLGIDRLRLAREVVAADLHPEFARWMGRISVPQGPGHSTMQAGWLALLSWVASGLSPLDGESQSSALARTAREVALSAKARGETLVGLGEGTEAAIALAAYERLKPEMVFVAAFSGEEGPLRAVAAVSIGLAQQASRQTL